MTWHHIDQQMAQFADELVGEVKLARSLCGKVATSIAADIRFLSSEQKTELRASTPIPIADRIAELQGFQAWMETANAIRGNPGITRAQVVAQNYICFVYLPEGCFRILAKHCPSGSVAKRCATFLSNNPVRAFRNAIAHANWTYRADFAALVYWARKGAEPDEPLQRHEVSQEQLAFWQALSRCVAYAALSNLDGG